MRIHTDTLTAEQVHGATAGLDGVWVEASRHGSRKRDHAWNVTLVATPRKGRRHRNTGQHGASEDAAATWDEWGVFLSWLFHFDPDATCDYYIDAEHYHWSTGGRFRNVVALDMHDQHRFEFHGDPMATPRAPYIEHSCKCGAIRRTLISATWDDVRETAAA